MTTHQLIATLKCSQAVDDIGQLLHSVVDLLLVERYVLVTIENSHGNVEIERVETHSNTFPGRLITLSSVDGRSSGCFQSLL